MAVSKETEAKQKQAYVEIEKHVKEAYAALEAAQQIADENNVSFSFAPAYGMGGAYYPFKDKAKVEVVEEDDGWYSSNEGWVSSSNNC